MATRSVRRRRAKPSPSAPTSSPDRHMAGVWRVVAPAAGSYDNDMVFMKTDDEAEARKCLRGRPAPCAQRPRGNRLRGCSTFTSVMTIRGGLGQCAATPCAPADLS
jgi:hypothetical protein